MHLPLVFLNKHVVETINAYGDRVAEKHLVGTTAARYWHRGDKVKRVLELSFIRGMSGLDI